MHIIHPLKLYDMKKKVVKVVLECLKYIIGAILGYLAT